MKGSIRKRGGTYTAYWSTNDPSHGKRRQHSKGGFRTKGAAQIYLNELLAQVQSGAWQKEAQITVQDFIELKWLPSLDAAVSGGSLKSTTRSNYRNVSYRYIIPSIGHIKLPALTSVRLNAFYTELLSHGRQSDGSGLSPTTVRQIHVSIHRMLRDAVKWGELQRNVAAHAIAPRAAKPKMMPWSPAQTREFIEKTSNDRLGPIWRLLALTGLRRGEVMGLQWEDVDLDQGRLTVARTRSMAAGRIAVSTPKTASSLRTIGLDNETVAALRTYKARQSREHLAAGEAWVNIDNYVIADEIGRPIHPTAISKYFQDARKATGMPKIRLHDLRHGYATAALEAGAPMKVVSDRLGHSSIMITADTYSHVRPEVDQALANQVASLIMAPTKALTNG
jgi:integrase